MFDIKVRCITINPPFKVVFNQMEPNEIIIYSNDKKDAVILSREAAIQLKKILCENPALWLEK